jgi:hypothetical protein
MASLSIYLFVLGGVALCLAFVLDVMHTSVLAAGRREVRLATPALAGAGVPGGAAAVTGGPPTGSRSYRSETRAGSIAHGFTWLAFLALVGSLAIRAYLVGRGPWGNMYEFSVSFAMGIVGGYLYLARRYAIRTIAFLPVGVALFRWGTRRPCPPRSSRWCRRCTTRRCSPSTWSWPC